MSHFPNTLRHQILRKMRIASGSGFPSSTWFPAQLLNGTSTESAVFPQYTLITNGQSDRARDDDGTQPVRIGRLFASRPKNAAQDYSRGRLGMALFNELEYRNAEGRVNSIDDHSASGRNLVSVDQSINQFILSHTNSIRSNIKISNKFILCLTGSTQGANAPLKQATHDGPVIRRLRC